MHSLSAKPLSEAAIEGQEGEDNYRFFFESLPIPALAFDLSSVRRYFERLSASGADVGSFFSENPEDGPACLALGRLVAMNASAIPFFADRLGREGRWDLKFLSSQSLGDFFLRALLGFWRGGRGASYEGLLMDSSSEPLFGTVHFTCPPASRDSWSLVFVSIVDCSGERRLAEELRGVAEEKGLLLRELQHRVKNNLAIIESFVDLERLGSADPRLSEALLPVSARIQSMASAYDLLSPEEGGARLCLDGYLRSILANVCSLSGMAPIAATVAPSGLVLDLDTTMRLGLVVDELALNSIKHAFPGADLPEGWKPRIAVSCSARGESLCLLYEDNGVGMPEGYDFGDEAGSGLGHLIVKALASQLGGELSLDSACGDATCGDGPRGMRLRLSWHRAQ